MKYYLKYLRNIFLSLCDYFFDYIKFSKYSGMGLNSRTQYNYKVLKAYHKIEKSLSFVNRKKTSGNAAAVELVRLLNKIKGKFNDFNYIDLQAICVLEKYSKVNDECSIEIMKFLKKYRNNLINESGSLEFSKKELYRGKLVNPESFFFSRYSIREFENKLLDLSLIYRAINLALKTPSACNRQPWKVYIYQDEKEIQEILKYQNGNAGFGDKIRNLIIICCDMEAFDTSGERNQYWIDGGMFAMSLVMSFHSLGIGSCCLNWSKGFRDDNELKNKLNIPKSYGILMFLAVGEPLENFKVCSSHRFDVSHYIAN